MNDGNAKQQIVDRIKKATNILVTLSKNPSVDELSAALGLTLMLNKLDKHATAVFSGATPPAIQFLEPDKTFENTVDSLRDFIIALDKEKADRLRYRVEDDVVRIFITPYRLRITEEDLKFTHGDFNVELVLALGVEKQEDLDEAIAAHGKILHDATVATLSAGNQKSSLGSIDWQEPKASSLCEMLVAISESLKGGLLDEQISTALLTGIVAATDRFSNNQTSSKSMTMAAQLMAAGANQQLIASKLEESAEISLPVDRSGDADNKAHINEGTSQRIHKEDAKSSKTGRDEAKSSAPNSADLGQLEIDHTTEAKASSETIPKPDETSKKPPADNTPPPLPQVPHATVEEHEKRNKKIASEEALNEALAELGNPPTSSSADAKPESDTDLESWPEAELGSEVSYIETGEDSAPGGLTPPVFQAGEGASQPAAEATHADTISEIESQIKRGAEKPDQAESLRQEISNIYGDDQKSDITNNQPQNNPNTQAPASFLPPPPLPDFSNLPPLPPNMAAAPSAVSQPTAVPNNPITPPVAPLANNPPDPNDPGQFHIPS